MNMSQGGLIRSPVSAAIHVVIQFSGNVDDCLIV